MLNQFKMNLAAWMAAGLLALTGCKLPQLTETPKALSVPAGFSGNSDTLSSASVQWRSFFNDPFLAALVDTALQNNQELRITLQEILIARNDIRVKQGKRMPSVLAGGGAGLEKVGRYTSQGAGDASTEMKPGEAVPEWLPDYRIGLYARWELDIWKKLRNEKAAAADRYLATVEGKNFVVTSLVAEIAGNYYELLGLDNKLDIVKENIGLLQNALDVVKVQKEAARVTELAVQKFEAELLHAKSLEYNIRQQISEKENTLNFLLGRYPQSILRDKNRFSRLLPQQVHAGIPAQLLTARPDIRQAEWELAAAKLDLKVARAEFLPSLDISSGIGMNAFKPAYLVRFPESLLFSLAGELAGPLINKNAIRAEFSNANARQLQALYQYDKTVLNAYVEVSTLLTGIRNLEQAYRLQSDQVQALVHAVDISTELFRSARADYLEVLMTQRDALDAKLELIETKMEQFSAVANIYRSLGGGWN